MNNPLLEWDALPPFSHIQAQDLEPAVDAVLKENRATLAKLATLSTPDWQNFIEPQETLADRLHRAWAPAAHLNSVMSSKALREAYNACLARLAEYDTELGQNAALQRGYQAIKAGPEWAGYSPAQRKLVDDALRDFRLAGVDLPIDKKTRFREVMQELTQREAKFEDNVLDATQGRITQVREAERTAGIPSAALERARREAEERKLEGWVFTLDYPSYSAVVIHADDRSLREEMYTAYLTRASDQGPDAGRWDNTAVMADILRLRLEAAKLTGYESYAAYSLADKMAKSPEEVLRFLTDLVARVRPVARHELLELSEYALERDGLKELRPWDVGYYAEKLKEERYHVSQEMLRPYFPAPKVTAGLFQVMHKLYGIGFAELPGADVWHPDVKLYELRDAAGALRGRLVPRSLHPQRQARRRLDGRDPGAAPYARKACRHLWLS